MGLAQNSGVLLRSAADHARQPVPDEAAAAAAAPRTHNQTRL